MYNVHVLMFYSHNINKMQKGIFWFKSNKYDNYAFRCVLYFQPNFNIMYDVLILKKNYIHYPQWIVIIENCFKPCCAFFYLHLLFHCIRKRRFLVIFYQYENVFNNLCVMHNFKIFYKFMKNFYTYYSYTNTTVKNIIFLYIYFNLNIASIYHQIKLNLFYKTRKPFLLYCYNIFIFANFFNYYYKDNLKVNISPKAAELFFSQSFQTGSARLELMSHPSCQPFGVFSRFFSDLV